MDKVTLAPDEDGYGFADGNEVVRTLLDGGAGRYGPDVRNAALRLSVQWTCDATEYEYMRGVYAQHVLEGHAPFAIDLFIDTMRFVEHQVRIVPGTFGLTTQAGLSFVVGCTLEVQPQPKPTATEPPGALTLPPVSSGYAFTDVAQAVMTELEGGLSRVRRDQLGVSNIVNVQWQCKPADYLYLRNFYNSWVTQPQESFTMDLLIDTAAMVEYNCKFVPGSMRLTSVQGHRAIVTAQIETIPPTEPPAEGGSAPWLFYPTEDWPGQFDDSLAPLHKRTYEYAPITGEPEPFSHGVGVTDALGEGPYENSQSVSEVYIPLFGDSGIPAEGQYTWEPADPEDDSVTPTFTDENPSGGQWDGPNLFVGLSTGGGPLIGWAGGVLTLFAGNNPDTGAGQITIITFLPSSFVYPPVSVYYGPLA